MPITCTILNHLGCVKYGGTSAPSIDLNLVSWDARAAKADLITWSADNNVQKGLSFTLEKLKEFRNIFNSLPLDTIEDASGLGIAEINNENVEEEVRP